MSLLKRIRLTVTNGIRYLPLLENLILRELKRKYRKSALGYLWCVLSPLFVMLIMNLVFSFMFRSNIENYPVYLFAGRMIFTFITDSTTNVTHSILDNGLLLRKARIPYYIFPAASFFGSVVNFGFSLIAFLIVLVFTGTPLSIHVVAFPLVLLELFMFCFGLGLLLSQFNVFLKDTSYLYAVITTGWMYLTPLFYPLESLPEFAQKLISFGNPAYYYISQSRSIFLYHQWPDPLMLLLGTGMGCLFLFIGLFAYSRCKDQLIYYV